MRAIAVFPKEKKVCLIDNHPIPMIETPTQVKVRVLEVGICGTDQDICRFQYGTPPEGCDYLVIGHESLSEVIEVGPEVKNLKVGDLVVLMVRRPCTDNNCIACKAGRQDFCYTGNFKERGINGLHGFMTEYLVEEEKYILKAPDHLRPIAVLTEPLTIAEKAIREVFHIQERLPWGCEHTHNHCDKPSYTYAHRALVLGAGPVGLLAALVLRSQAFDTFVYSLEPNSDLRAQIVTSLGATYFSAKQYGLHDITEKSVVPAVAQTPSVVRDANPSNTPANPASNKIKGNLDVIFDGTGASRLAFEATDILGFNGIFVWTGIPGRQDPVDINAGTFMQNVVLKNQNLVGSVNAGHEDFQSAISDLDFLLSNAAHLTQSLITAHAMEDFEKVLLQKPAPGTFKNILKIAKT